MGTVLDSTTIRDEDLYRIGTVASLTGISVERLRAWERRYQLSPAHKAGKTRYYSGEQLERFKLIKHLIDQGQPISSLVGLATAQLEERLGHHTHAAHEVQSPALRPNVALLGANLLMMEQAEAGPATDALNITARWANLAAFEAEAQALQSPDVVWSSSLFWTAKSLN